MSEDKEMLGLFLFTYDYYEWEELIAVSLDEDKLKERHKAYDGLYDDKELISLDQHKARAPRDEEPHFVIMPVEYI